MTFLEAGGIAEVLAAADAGAVDLAILDSEAQPTGGMGLCRQLKNEIEDCPPLVVTAQRLTGEEAQPVASVSKLSVAEMLLPSS